ncbi:MAG: hypothetical protein ACLR4Z_02475 [Butyricicoccaceae bacterium]
MRGHPASCWSQAGVCARTARASSTTAAPASKFDNPRYRRLHVLPQAASSG